MLSLTGGDCSSTAALSCPEWRSNRQVRRCFLFGPSSKKNVRSSPEQRFDFYMWADRQTICFDIMASNEVVNGGGNSGPAVRPSGRVAMVLFRLNFGQRGQSIATLWIRYVQTYSHVHIRTYIFLTQTTKPKILKRTPRHRKISQNAQIRF